MVLVPVLHKHSKHHQAADPGADRGCASAVWKKSWRLLLVRSSATLVQATGDSTGGLAQICCGDNTAEQIVNVPVPQIQEQNVEVIKVILQEQCQRMRFFFESVLGGGCGLHGKSVLLHSLTHTRGLAYFDSVWKAELWALPTREVRF